MVFTSLHRALGIPASELSFAMLNQAVENGVTEQTDLDWKLKFPDSRDPSAKAEFAKDIAAMINSGGGMILYGIRENEQAAASEIVGVGDWTDGEERRLRQIAYAYVQPPIQNLEFTPLKEGTTTVVALTVPSSPDTPHFQLRPNSGFFRAPRRYGAQTVDMSERDIEQAYRSRFADRQARERTLEDLSSDVTLGLPEHGGVRMTAAAIPLNPRPTQYGRLTKEAAQEIIQDLRDNPFIAAQNQNRFTSIDANARIGYRKWRSLLPSGRGAVDIHDDGSVALTFNAARDRDFEVYDVHVMDAHHLPAFAVRLVQVAATRLGISGSYQLHLDLESNWDPLYIRTFENGSFLVDREDLTPIHRFRQVRALVDGQDGNDALLEYVHSLALDVLNQAGIIQVLATYIPSLKPRN